MDFATRNWFGYINENIRIDEGLRDIGLSEFVADAIEASIADAPENAKTWLGHMWKKTHLHQFVRPSNRIQEFRFNTMEPLLVCSRLLDRVCEAGGFRSSRTRSSV